MLENNATQADKLQQDFVVINTAEEHQNKLEKQLPPSASEIRRMHVNNAIATYDPSNKMYSVYLGESGTANTLSQETIERLGEGAQDDVEKIREINNIIRKYINIDDLLGMIVQAISNNINTELQLSYKNFGEQRNKSKILSKTKALINDFNVQVDIEKFIRDATTIAYTEGNYLCLLRNDNTNWNISKLSLGIAEQSGYVEHGNPVILINIKSLSDVLKENKPLTNKKKQPLFFKNYEEEVRATYNDDVAKAYKDKESYVRLDTGYTGTVRVNNYGRRYGLSPIARALSATLMLSYFNKADESSAQAKSKKIIHQVMDNKLLDNYDPDTSYEELAFVHDNFLRAFRQSTVFVSTPPSVARIEYIEPKTEDVSEEKVNLYRHKVLSSLGIAFLANDKSQTASTANINLQQLLQCINSITSSVVKVIENFYRTLLTVNNIPLEYLPTVKIDRSELLDMDLKIELSKLLYSTFNVSMETSLAMIDIDLENEKVLREKENADGLEEIFKPRANFYAPIKDSDDKGGRPQDSNPKNPDKQLEDEQYNDNARN